MPSAVSGQSLCHDAAFKDGRWDCFRAFYIHKFRAVLGKNRLIFPGEKVVCWGDSSAGSPAGKPSPPGPWLSAPASPPSVMHR